MILIGPSGDTATLVLPGGLARCEPSPSLSASMPDVVVKESSCSLSSCNKGTKSFLKIVKISGLKDMFPLSESGCSFWTAGGLDGGLCWKEMSLEHMLASAGIFPPCAWYDCVAAVAASAIEFDDNKFDSSSCIEANDLHGSSGNEASTRGDKGEKKEEIQFFVNYGKGLWLYVAVLTLLCRMYFIVAMRSTQCVVHALSGWMIPFIRMALKVG